ncbi:hypothetical protein BZA77DRAFT_359099 [Pyronema omphalodes]|nr:hypothetical protein BZA77DRAFT_359099 [Pyronema omphalodes]
MSRFFDVLLTPLTYPSFSSSIYTLSTNCNHLQSNHFSTTQSHNSGCAMTLHQILPGLTSSPTSQSSTPTSISGKQNMQVSKDNAVSVDATHSPVQEPKPLYDAVGKQSSNLSTAVKDQIQNRPGLQQHMEHITMDTDRLTKENNRLLKENDRLVTGYNKLEERYNQLKEDNDRISEEIRQLKKQLAVVDEQSKSNSPKTQKLINHLTTENDQLKEAREAAIEQLKAQPIMQDMIRT